ncbi:MAG: hypothetical protein KDK25_09310 [Leptospiraceae bacterium]|nr:hypothetical protein [Leptospiraceae bacterium]
MRKRLILGLALGLSISVAGAALACNQKDDDNTETLALLALAAGNGKQQYSDATAAVSGVTQSLSSNPNQVYNEYGKPDVLLARKFATDPHVMLTALTESSGSCSYSAPNFNCDAVVSGDIACASGGTATFTNVSFKYQGSYSSGLTIAINGPITYNNCIVSYYDYANGGASKLATLNGGVNMDSSGTLTFSVSGTNPATVTVNQNETSTVVNNSLQINGNGASFGTVTVKSDINGTTTISTSIAGSVATSTVTSTLSGSITVNGSTIVNYDGTSQTTTCTTDTSTYETSCTNI